jgi:hypothetical protein
MTEPDHHAEPARPTNVAVVLLDSLNRHLLGCYGGTEFDTPNLDRFAAERATRFTRHVTGSLPCMPARHDICAARSTSSGSRGDRSRSGRSRSPVPSSGPASPRCS